MVHLITYRFPTSVCVLITPVFLLISRITVGLKTSRSKFQNLSLNNYLTNQKLTQPPDCQEISETNQ